MNTLRTPIALTAALVLLIAFGTCASATPTRGSPAPIRQATAAIYPPASTTATLELYGTFHAMGVIVTIDADPNTATMTVLATMLTPGRHRTLARMSDSRQSRGSTCRW